jgi:hypothetical protein
MKVEAVVGTIFFVAAMVLSLLKYPDYVTKETQLDSKVSRYARSMYYLYGYANILLKALVVLVFIFVFIMVFNVITLGVFKPLMSDSVGSDESVYANTGYGDIVMKAKDGYFALLGAVAQKVFQTTFHVVKYNTVMTALLVFAPIFILCVAFVFLYVWDPKVKLKEPDENDDEILSSLEDEVEMGAYLHVSYQLLSLLFITLFVILLIYTALHCLT